MEKYESKQVRILRPASDVYRLVSDFTNFTPVLGDRVEAWQATADTCSFRAQGFTVGLRIVERRENELVRVEGDGGTPFDFTFWLQLKETAPDDTRMRLVLHVKLNMMMKMMIGGKIAKALDQIAEKIADTFNGKLKLEN